MNHLELVLKHPVHLSSPVKWKGEYSRTTPNACERPLHTLLALRGSGSRRFEALEPPQLSAETPGTPCFPCKAVAREGSVQVTHADLL